MSHPVFTTRDSFIYDGGLSDVDTAQLDHDDCCICLHPYFPPEDFEDGAVLYEEPLQLPCNHVFGANCILRWTRDNASCPCCRAKLYDENGIENSDAFHAELIGTSDSNVPYGFLGDCEWDSDYVDFFPEEHDFEEPQPFVVYPGSKKDIDIFASIFEIEMEIAVSDAVGLDLLECHNQWMGEYLDDYEDEVPYEFED